MITLKEFEAMPAGHIFFEGGGIFRNYAGELDFRKYIAIKSRTENVLDWAIYYSEKVTIVRLRYVFQDNKWILEMGDKLHDPVIIKTILEVDDEVLNLYRQ